MLFKLLNFAFNESISAMDNRKGVSTLTIWNVTSLIGVVTSLAPIKLVEPILNQILALSALVLSSLTGWILAKAKNWRYPRVDT